MKTKAQETKTDWTYGFWIDRNGLSYWGIQLAGTISIGESVHRLPVAAKKNLTSWRFNEKVPSN